MRTIGKVLKITCLLAVLAPSFWIGFQHGMGSDLQTLSDRRLPASYDEFDYDPDLYSDLSISDLEVRSAHPSESSYQSRKNSQVFIPISQTRIGDAAKQGLIHPDIDAKRIRSVRLNKEKFLIATNTRVLDLELFSDFQIRVLLQAPSSYAVNHWLYVGQVQGDTNSQVRIMYDGENMNATIEADGRSFRILPAGSGRLDIVELAPKRRWLKNQ